MGTIVKNKISLMFLVICKSIKQKWWESFVRIYLIKWFTVYFATKYEGSLTLRDVKKYYVEKLNIFEIKTVNHSI